jgi:hypothetical protein
MKPGVERSYGNPGDPKVTKAHITLKALANFSPGFALKPWVKKCFSDSSQL